jgi:phosphate uptake regulator
MASKCEYSLSEGISTELTRFESTFVDLIDDSITFLLQMNSEKANQLIDKTREIRDQIQILANSTKLKDRSEMMVRLIVASSIERMLDYIMNIGELTINLSHAIAQPKAA